MLFIGMSELMCVPFPAESSISPGRVSHHLTAHPNQYLCQMCVASSISVYDAGIQSIQKVSVPPNPLKFPGKLP